MGWEDRPYYRDRGRSAGFNPFMWVLTGSVPLFTAFGIRVRAHATLVLTVALVLLFGFGYPGFSLADRVQFSTVLFLIVLLHEFGHCFTARWVGGEAEDILMHPLGGLAFARPPHRPLPTFLTVAGGPAVNIVICLLCGAVLAGLGSNFPWNPFRPEPPSYRIDPKFWLVASTAYWVYQVSWQLFVFNMMPIFPLDGGQMLQAILWPKFGYYRSMNFACITGMIGSVFGAMVALAFGNISLAILAVFGFLSCYNLRMQLKAVGPAEFESEFAGGGYSAGSYTTENRARRKSNDRAQKRLQKLREDEASEQQKIDAILAKVSATGMQSLTWVEKRALRQATEQQRQRDAEMRKLRR